MKKARCLAILLILHFSYLTAQLPIERYQTTLYTSDQGLPHRLIFDITQDHKGFIWIGTNNGLARFDGYTFKTYRPEPKNSNSISNKSVCKLYFDTKDQLWINLQTEGLNKLDLNTETFKIHPNNPNDSTSIKGHTAKLFYEDDKSNLWIVTNKGLEHYNRQDKAFSEQLENTSLKEYRHDILSIWPDYKQRLWLRTSNKIACLDLNTKEPLELDSILPIKQPAFTLDANDCLIENQAILWLATVKNGIQSYNLKTKELANTYPYLLNTHNLFLNQSNTLFCIRHTKTEDQIVAIKTKRPQLSPIIVATFETGALTSTSKFKQDSKKIPI